jgi:hypothetical protein
MKLRSFELAAKQIAANYNTVLGIIVAQIAATRPAVVRDLRPYDLGDTTNTDYFTVTYTGTGWQTIYSTTVPNRKAYGIYGISLPNTTQVTTAIRIRAGASTARWIMLQELYDGNTKEGRTVYLYPDDQLVVQENNQLVIEGYALSATTDNVVILGFVGEPETEIVYKKSSRIESI